jgi:hypothetical protein
MNRTRTMICGLLMSCGLALPALAQMVPPIQEGQGLAVDVRPVANLFLPAPEALAAPSPGEFRHAQSLKLDVAALGAMKPGRLVEIETEGVKDRWVVSSISEPNADYRLVRLKHETDPAGYAVFCTYQDATALTMQIPSRQKLYRLHFAGGDIYHLWRFDLDNAPREARPLTAIPEMPLERGPLDDDWRPDEPGGYTQRDAGACGGTSRVLDIMIVYTVQARDAIGGTTAMRAECALAVDHANTAYQASAMSTRMRLVYCNEIAYTESGDQDIDLPRLRSTNDGFMDSVHTTRDTVNADMVALVNDTGSGLGYCPGGAPTYAGSPFNTCKWTRVAATFTLAHETGHNLGAGHDVANDGACGPSYGVGHLFGPVGNGWCTVMAYPTGSNPRVLQFSNPNITYNGYATGVAIGAPGEAFNARVIIDNDNTVEGFEGTRYDIYVNFSYVGIEVGLPAFPYNTLSEGITNIDTPNTGAGENPTMYITTGSTSYTGTISKVMNIIPCSGPVTIGN